MRSMLLARAYSKLRPASQARAGSWCWSVVPVCLYTPILPTQSSGGAAGGRRGAAGVPAAGGRARGRRRRACAHAPALRHPV